MGNIYNLDFDLTAMCFLIVTLAYHTIQYHNSVISSRAFGYVIQSCLVFTIFDIFSCLAIEYYYMIPKWLNWFANTMYFVSETLCLYTFMYYAKKNTSLKLNNTVVLILDYGVMLLFLGLLVLNLKYGFIFVISEDNIYSGGKYYGIAPLAACYYFLYAAIVFLSKYKDYNFKQISAFMSFIVFGVGGIVVQWFFFPTVMCCPFGMALACYIMMSALETPDYHKLKLTMKELEIAKEEALSAAETKNRFLANMSHEIRTPINAILGMDEMIIRESHESEVVEYAENIQAASSSLLTLLNDILDFSKMENGKLELVFDDYELDNMVTSILLLLLPRATSKGLKLDVDVDERIPNKLFGDEVRLKQCFINILSNAIKYTDVGEVKLTVTYEDVPNEDSIILKVSVKDTGKGIKEEDLKQLFTPFERLEEKRNRNVEGSGLGMAITQQILGMMGSQLNVSSTYNVGSTFSFEVRQVVKDKTPIGNFEESYRRQRKKRKEYKESFVAPNAHILAVDDVDMNLTLLLGLLKRTQVQLDTCLTGKEAIALASQKHYDLMLIDQMMPKMDGTEVLNHIRNDLGSLNKNCPMIVLTANAIQGAKEKYLESGFDNYLSKPIDSQVLEEMLIQYLPPDLVSKTIVEDESHFEFDKVLQIINNISGVDMMEGIKVAGGVDLYKKVCKEFYETITYRANLLEDYEVSEEYKEYEIQVHALKSSARLVGAMELSKMAEEAEKMAGGSKPQGIHILNKYIVLKYRELKDEFAKAFKNTGELPLISKDEVIDALKSVYGAMEEFDFDEASMIMNSLERYELPEDFEETYCVLKGLMADVARDEILISIESYIGG